MIRVAYILSGIHKALAFEWIAEKLDRQKFDLRFVLLNSGDSALEDFLKKHQVPVTRITYRGKKNLPKAVLQICRLLKKHNIQAVHCHMFDANVAGLLAARLAEVKKRIYTRHYATFHHEYFPRAVWYDRFVNAQATDIVAISENVRQVLIEMEHVLPQKITLIHHGFELKDFAQPSAESVARLHEKYLFAKQGPVVGNISRYFELKGLQYVIPAFQKLLQTYPSAHLVLANATGNYTAEVKKLLAELPASSYTEIQFEEDLFALYQLFDIFVHVPVNPRIEAFGQTYVEALAAGIPSIFTLSGVATEFIKNGQNAWVVPFKDTAAIHTAMLNLLSDEDLRNRLIVNGRESVQSRFGLEQMMGKLENLYQKL